MPPDAGCWTTTDKLLSDKLHLTTVSGAKNKIDSLFPDDLIGVTYKRMVTYELQSFRAISDSVIRKYQVFLKLCTS